MTSNKATWAFALARSGDAIDLDIYDTIGNGGLFGGGIRAQDVRAKLQAHQSAKTIRCRINSAGGEVIDGTAIYNILREHKARVEVDIDGIAASMASVIAMAGNEIRIASNAYMMVHRPWGAALGQADDMRSTADVLDKMEGQLAEIYAARTGQTKEKCLELMAAETWMTASEAKELGFVDSVTNTSNAKAMARISLSAFERAPSPLVQAVARARESLHRDAGLSMFGTYKGKVYAELKPAERVAWKSEQPEIFEKVRVAHEDAQAAIAAAPWKFKRWDELRGPEKAAWRAANPDGYAAARAAALGKDA